jgi:hypothetical protein
MPADDTYLWVGPAVNSWQQGEALTKMKEDLAKPFLWAEREVRTRPPKLCHSSDPMTLAIATSPGSSLSSMEAWPKSDLDQ